MSIYEGSFCRCCAADGPSRDLITTYNWMGEEEVYADMLRECFDINMDTGEEDGICGVCITQLRNAFNFKKQVQHTEEQFKNKLLFKGKSLAKVKLEIEQNKTSDSETDALDMGADHDSDPEYEVPIKKEPAEAPLKPKAKRRASAAASKAKKVKTEGETSKSTQDSTDNAPLSDQPTTPGKKRRQNEVRRLNMINLRSILLYSNASLIRDKGLEGFRCVCCAQSYPSAVELKGHFIEEHSNRETIIRLPNKSFEIRAKLDVSFLNCAICNKDMDSIDLLISHLSDYHDVETYPGILSTLIPYKFEKEGLNCAICEGPQSSFKVLTEHMNSHFRNFICEVCGLGFVSTQVYRAHLQRHGTGETFPCQQCKLVFNAQIKLTDHVKRVHLGVKRNKCDLCGKRFLDYHSKRAHLRKEHQFEFDKVICQACGKVFLSQRRLRIHVKKDHLMERNHVCKCGKSFFSKTQLTEHQACHRKDLGFHCGVEGCKRRYSSKKALRYHMRSAHPELRKVQGEEEQVLDQERDSSNEGGPISTGPDGGRDKILFLV